MSRFAKIRQRVGGWIAGVRNAVDYGPFTSWFTPRNIWSVLTERKLTTSEFIFAAISRLSSSMGMLPLALYDASYNKVSTTNADTLIYGPSPNLHRWEFIRTMEALRSSEGNAYAMKEYDSRYLVKGFHLLDPNKVTPVIESNSRELYYRVQGETGDYYVHNMDMLHVKHVSTTGGLAGLSYMGISPLKVLEGALDFDAKVAEFTLDQIENAVRASFILSMASMVDDTKKAAVLESFRSFYAENGGVLLEEQGSKIQELKGGNNLDTKLLDVKKVTRARVAEVLGLPDPDVTSYNSIEQEQMRYVQQTIVGIATQYEAEFDRKLLTFDDRKKGLHFRFNLGVLMRADSSGRMDYYFKGIRTMVLKPNECRAWEELPPEPGGEKLYCSRDLSPVGEVQPTTTPQGGQRNG